MRTIVRLVLGVALAGMLAYLGAYSFSQAKKALAIDEIVVTGWDAETSLLGLERVYRQNLPLLSQEQIKQHLARRNPRIKQIFLTKQYPNTLLVDITMRTPFVVLSVANGTYKLDQEAVVVQKLSTTGQDEQDQQLPRDGSQLPQIRFYQKIPFNQYHLGERVDLSEISTAIELADFLSSIGYAADRIDIDSSDMIRCYIGDLTVLFSPRRDGAVQQYELKEILGEYVKNEKALKSVDLRFDKPVVVFY